MPLCSRPQALNGDGVHHLTHSSQLLPIPAAQPRSHIFNRSEARTSACFPSVVLKLRVCILRVFTTSRKRKLVYLKNLRRRKVKQEERRKVFFRFRCSSSLWDKEAVFLTLLCVCVCPCWCSVLCLSHRECVFVTKVLEKLSWPRGPPI